MHQYHAPSSEKAQPGDSVATLPVATDDNAFHRFWAAGFKTLIPIVPPTAEISEHSTLFKRVGTTQDARGKVPGVRGRDSRWFGLEWQNYIADLEDLRRWHAIGAGVGIKTGDGVAAIDADTLDHELARVIRDEIEATFGRLPIRVGFYPKAIYLVRLSAPMPYTRIEFGAERVEVLTEGRQFVASGIHPKTGKPYTWPRDIPSFDDIPVVDPDQVVALLDRLRGKLPAASRLITEGGTSTVSQAALRGTLEAVRKAVEATPNTSNHFPSRESYRDFGYAIKAALPDHPDEALDIFQDWCARWTDGTNDPDVVAADWARMRPPYRRGASWLYELAEQRSLTGFSRADVWFEPIAEEGAGAAAGELDPRDIFGDGEMGAATLEIPPGALPAVLDRWVRDVSEIVGAPPAFAAAAALATISGAIGSKLRIQPKEYDTSWTEPAFLWFAIVEAPGGKKSPIISRATAPLSRVDARRAKEGAEAWARWDARKRAAKRGEPFSEPEPKVRRHVVEGFTMEAITSILADNPSGLLVRQDELTQLIGSLDAYKSNKGADRPLMLSLFDGRETRVDRVGRKHLHIQNFGAAVVGAIQPRKISEMASNLDADGFLQRFLPSFGDGERRQGLDRVPDHEAETAYENAVVQLAEAEFLRPVPVTLSPAAHVVWRRVTERLTALAGLPGMSDAWAGHLGKWPAFAARLLLTCHILANLGDRLADVDRREVSEETALQASGLVDWQVKNSLRFYVECIGAGEAGDDAKWIAGYILAKGATGQITRREIGDKKGDLRGNPDRIARAMRFLQENDWCVPDSTTRVDKHGPSRWTICPLVHDGRFTPRAEQERKRRAAARVRIDAAVAERRRLLGQVTDDE